MAIFLLSGMTRSGRICCPKLRWAVQGELAYDVLVEIRPYLILKRQQADLAMQLQYLIREGRAQRGRCFWTADWRQQASSLKEQMIKLNERGVLSVAYNSYVES